MLEGHVEVRQDLAFGHQRNQLIDTRIRINVVQAHPDAEFGQCLAQLLQARLDRAAAIEAGTVLHIDAISARILRDDQQLAHAGLGQILRLLQHIADRPADQGPAQGRNDAEGATVIASFGNLQIGKVLRRELHTLRRHQTGEGIVWLRQMLMHMLKHFVGGMRAGDRQHLGMRAAHQILLGTQAAGNNHLAVLGQRLADRVKRLFNRRIDKAAGIDDDQIGTLVGRRNQIALRTQLGQNLLRIDQRLGTAQADKTYR